MCRADAIIRLLLALLILRHGRREILWFRVTAHPTAEWLARQVTEAIGWEKPPKYLVRDEIGYMAMPLWAVSGRWASGIGRPRPALPGRTDIASGRSAHPTGVFGPRDYLGRAPSSQSAALLCELLQSEPNPPVLKQGCADESSTLWRIVAIHTLVDSITIRPDMIFGKDTVRR